MCRHVVERNRVTDKFDPYSMIERYTTEVHMPLGMNEPWLPPGCLNILESWHWVTNIGSKSIKITGATLYTFVIHHHHILRIVKLSNLLKKRVKCEGNFLKNMLISLHEKNSRISFYSLYFLRASSVLDICSVWMTDTVNFIHLHVKNIV